MDPTRDEEKHPGTTASVSRTVLQTGFGIFLMGVDRSEEVYSGRERGTNAGLGTGGLSDRALRFMGRDRVRQVSDEPFRKGRFSLRISV